MTNIEEAALRVRDEMVKQACGKIELLDPNDPYILWDADSNASYDCRDIAKSALGLEIEAKTKRYLVFAFLKWEPNGGWDDFQGHFDSLEEAKNYSDEFRLVPEYALHIVDSETREIVHVGKSK